MPPFGSEQSEPFRAREGRLSAGVRILGVLRPKILVNKISTPQNVCSRFFCILIQFVALLVFLFLGKPNGMITLESYISASSCVDLSHHSP